MASPPKKAAEIMTTRLTKVPQVDPTSPSSLASRLGGLRYATTAVINPLPYFPTTGRLIENKYYEVNPNTFSAAALYQSLQLP